MPTVSFGSLTTVNTVSISILITDSSGNIQTTMAGNVQTPIIGLTKTQIIVRVDGAQVTIPQNGYVLVTILSSSARITMYWGTGQFTNFQVPYRILS
jgi:hypothetical protein